MVGGKIFLAMSNLYFFNQSRGIHMDFNVAFHLVLVPNFTTIFLVKVVTAQHEGYLAKEHSLNV